MTLLPKHTETIISSFAPLRIEQRLLEITASPTLKINKVPRNKTFQGKVGDMAFVLSRRISHPNNFVPLVRGLIEPTKKGSIIFLKYTLFGSSLMFLVIAVSIALIVGICFIVVKAPWSYSAIAFAFGIANYVVALLNFRKQVKITRDHLIDALNIA
jgi:hypothetical protein